MRNSVAICSKHPVNFVTFRRLQGAERVLRAKKQEMLLDAFRKRPSGIPRR